MLFLKQTKIKWSVIGRALLPVILILLLAGFIPAYQGVQRFVTIITQNITASNAATFNGSSTFNGATDLNSTVDFSDATVSGLGEYYATDDSGNVTITGTLAVSDTSTFTSAITALSGATVSGATALNGGITADSTAFSVADTTGDTVISGTLSVSSTTLLYDDLNMTSQPIVNIGAGGTDFGTDGSLTTAAAITITAGNLTLSSGNADVSGSLNFGANDLYPLGYASDGQEFECGTTSTFTGSTQITPSELTTPTYVIVSQITQPAATAAFITASDPTTTTFDISSWGADYNTGTTGVAAHWCAVGDE